MTTLQKFPNAYVDEGGFVYAWDRPEWMLVDDPTGRMARVALYLPYGYTPSSWVRFGFDFSALPAGTVVSGVTIDLFDTYGYSPFGASSSRIEAQYWDGEQWVDVASKTLTNAPADYSMASFTVSRDVLLGWSLGYGVRVRAALNSGAHTTENYIGAVAVTATYASPSVPTVTAISPAKGSIAGGTTVTVTGTGFQFNGQNVVSGVTIGGVACTEVSVVSDTSLTCVAGAHAAGAVDVVVTNSGGSGTLTNGFAYLSVVDNIVKLVKGGTVVGNNQASATAWPTEPVVASYGGQADLWGTTLTPADVNASAFGFVLSATVGSGAEARLDHAALRIYYTVPGITDPSTLVAVLRVDSDRQTARPDLYKLPRSGFTVGNDPQIDRAVDDAEFRLSRIYQPSRSVEKVWHSFDFWLDADPEGNTPGVQIWARVDEGTEFQLNDGSGSPATLYTSGPKEVFFPKNDRSRGYYVQIIVKVPALAVPQVGGAYTLRNLGLHLAFRPKRAETYDYVLILGDGEYEDRTSMRRTVGKQLTDLKRLIKRGLPAIPIRDPEGNDLYGHVVGLSWREVTFKGAPQKWATVATVKVRMARYE